MLFLTESLVSQSDLVSELFQLMSVLLCFSAALVLVTLFELFELCLLLISQLGQALPSLIQLMAKILNQMRLFFFELLTITSVLLESCLKHGVFTR